MPRGDRIDFYNLAQTDETYRDLVVSRHKLSKNFCQQLHLKTARYYSMYRGWQSGRYDQFRNSVSLPLVFSTVWADISRKMNTSFATWPYVGMFGHGQEDAMIARQQELLISAQMEDAETYRKAIEFFLMADLYGTAVIQTGWNFKEEMLMRRENLVTPLTNKNVERILTEKIITFDGPDFDLVDTLDFFPKPNVARLEDMDWKIVRHYLDIDDIDALADQGVFDKSAVAELRAQGIRQTTEDELKTRFMSQRTIYDDSTDRDKYARPVELLTMWGGVPEPLVPKDGAKRRVITLANNMVVLRNRPNPYWHGRDPFLAYSPILDPHYFHGPSKAEIAERMQLTANRLANQKLDALDLVIDPVFLYDRNADIETRNLFMRAGKLIGVTGPPAQAVQAVFPDMRGVEAAYTEIQSLWQWLQQATGIVEDTVMGAGGGGGQTAREFLGRQENVSVRLLLESRIAEKMWIEPLAQQFRAYNRQFLPIPHMRRILGSNAIVDPVTQMPISQEIIVQGQDLYLDYDVRAMGSTTNIPKSAKQQNYTLLLQALQANPMAFQFINWMAFFRDMFRTFEFQNVDEMFNIPPAQQAAMMQQNMAQAGGSPGAVPGQTPPPGLPGSTNQMADPASLPPMPGLEQGGMNM